MPPNLPSSHATGQQVGDAEDQGPAAVHLPRSQSKSNQVLAGAGAGIVTALVTCPLDVLKTRLQNQPSANQQNYRGILPSLRRIWREEGIRGLYKGLTPTILGYLPTWMIYFGTYDLYKHLLADWVVEWQETSRQFKHQRRQLELNQAPPLDYYSTESFAKSYEDRVDQVLQKPIIHLGGSMMAGLTSTFITNPFWVIKTRMMIQKVNAEDAYHSVRHACVEIWRRDGGIRGFYKGMIPSLLGVLHVGVQFPLYEYLKRSSLQTHENDATHQPTHGHGHPNITSVLYASMISKFIASVVTYPHEVIRTRLQSEPTPPVKYFSFRQTVGRIATEEGIRGFYKGMATNLVRTVPASAMTLLTYEALDALFNPNQ